MYFFYRLKDLLMCLNLINIDSIIPLNPQVVNCFPTQHLWDNSLDVC